MSKAHFEDNDKTFGELRLDVQPETAPGTARDLATVAIVRKGMFCCAVLSYNASGRRLATRQQQGPCRVHQTRLLSDLGGGHADGTWDLSAAPLPAGAAVDPRRLRHAQYTTQQADDLYEPSVTIRAGSPSSPVPLTGWYPLFPLIRPWPRALDRLLGRAHHLVLEGRSTANSSDRTAATAAETST